MNKNLVELIVFLSLCCIFILLICYYLIFTYKRVISGRLSVKEQIETSKVIAWRNLRNFGYRVTYRLESLKEVDRFIDDNVIDGEPKKDG